VYFARAPEANVIGLPNLFPTFARISARPGDLPNAVRSATTSTAAASLELNRDPTGARIAGREFDEFGHTLCPDSARTIEMVCP